MAADTVKRYIDSTLHEVQLSTASNLIDAFRSLYCSNPLVEIELVALCAHLQARRIMIENINSIPETEKSI